MLLLSTWCAARRQPSLACCRIAQDGIVTQFAASEGQGAKPGRRTLSCRGRAPFAIQRGELFVAERDPAAATFSSRCVTLPVPGIGSITGLRFSTQARAIGRASPCGVWRSASSPSPAPARSPAASGYQGMKPMPLRLAIVEHVFALAVGEIVEVLHGRRRGRAWRRLDLVDADFAEARMADDAVVDQLLDARELFVARDFRVDAVQLPEVDAARRRGASGCLCVCDQIFGPAERAPDVRARCASGRPWWRSGCRRVGMERLADQLLGHVRAVGIGGVDEIDAELRQALQGARWLRRGRAAGPRCRGR